MCTKASSAKQLVWNPRPRTNRQHTRRDASKNCLRLGIVQENKIIQQGKRPKVGLGYDHTNDNTFQC